MTIEPKACAVVRGEMSELPGLLEKLSGFMRELEFSPDEIGDAELALDEAFTNIVKHGYQGKEGEILLRCNGLSGWVSITLEDTAPKFNPLTLPPPPLGDDIDDRKIGGLGVMLIRGVMDRCHYEYRNGRNIFTMEKRHVWQ